jgi:hypothetical protein
MSKGFDHISELRPPPGPLFIPQVIYEHEETWWNDIDRGKLLIRPPERSPALLPAEPSSSKLGGGG